MWAAFARYDSVQAYRNSSSGQIVGDLRSAKASFRSPYGLIRSEWTTEQAVSTCWWCRPTPRRGFMSPPCRQPGLQAGSKSRSARIKPRYRGRVPRIRRRVGYLPLRRAIAIRFGKGAVLRKYGPPSFCHRDAIRVSPQSLRKGSCIIPALFLQTSRRLPARCPHSP